MPVVSSGAHRSAGVAEQDGARGGRCRAARGAHIWTSNWERILPLLVATRALVSEALRDELVKRCERPLALAALQRLDIERDPMLLRGAVFDLLHGGGLQAESLRTTPLSPLTQFVRRR